MNVYKNIVATNPEGTFRLCQAYQLVPQSDDEAAWFLETIANQDEQGKREVLDLHPDKDILIQSYSLKQNSNKCGGCSGNCSDRLQSMKVAMGADGRWTAMKESMHQFANNNQSTTVIIAILAATTLLGIALITSNKTVNPIASHGITR